MLLGVLCCFGRFQEGRERRLWLCPSGRCRLVYSHWSRCRRGYRRLLPFSIRRSIWGGGLDREVGCTITCVSLYHGRNNLLRKEYFRNSSLRANVTLYQPDINEKSPSHIVPSTSLNVAGHPECGIFRFRWEPVDDFGSGTLTSNIVNVTHLLYSAKSNDGPTNSPGKKKI